MLPRAIGGGSLGVLMIFHPMSRLGAFARRAFTLVELLIVIAIIAILALIAVPNFLEAQTRAKVARAKADLRTVATGVMTYVVDYNNPFPDGNDPGSPPDLAGLTFESENHVAPDLQFLNDGLGQYYTFRAWRPLTTPVAYLTSSPRDPFSKIMPLAYDTRLVDGRVAYCAAACSGPDRLEGHWLRIATGTGMAITYDPTNGTISAGETWRAMCVQNAELFRSEYGPEVP